MKDSCYTFTTKGNLKEKDVQKEFGNLLETRSKIFAFLRREEEAHIIPLEQLGEHEVAFFENNIETGTVNYETFEPVKKFSLEDVLANFVVDTKKQTVTAKKLYRFQGRYYMRTRKYDMKNYGKMWRAWTGIPKEHYVW